MTKVLVVATSRKTRGGITSVVKAHETGEQWNMFHCRWIETHRDGNLLKKVALVVLAMVRYALLLPLYDIVHIHISEAPSAFRKLFFIWWAKLLKKKTIVHFHSFSPETTIRGDYRGLYEYLFHKADKVIVLSEYWKREIEKEITGVNTVVLYNPCTTSLDERNGFKNKTSKNNTTPFADYEGPMLTKHAILYAGTVNQRKGYADMIKAFAKIAKYHEDWSIVFAGNGEIEKGQAMAMDLGISKQVLWLGWISGADKDRAFREATIFCLPSYAEGFPMAVLDAWSYGIPVITTPVGGIPDVAVDGENMLLFEPGDVDALALQMKRMITDAELRQKISYASKELAYTTFNVDIINKQLGEIYEEVLRS